MIKVCCLILISIALRASEGFYVKSNKNASVKTSKIVGGNAIDISEAPYQAQIIEGMLQDCGAVIISDIWLLTAAHCILMNKDIAILTGSSIRNQGSYHPVAHAIVHENYDDETLDNDIALIRLVNPIMFNMNQKPINITSQPPKAWQEVKITGFGKMGDGLPASPVLKAARTPIKDMQECKDIYKDDTPVTDNMFCAGNGITDSCSGDSGGPAVINNELVGIASSGNGCGSKQYPGVYTAVYNYRNWISTNAKIPI